MYKKGWLPFMGDRCDGVSHLDIHQAWLMWLPHCWTGDYPLSSPGDTFIVVGSWSSFERRGGIVWKWSDKE